MKRGCFFLLFSLFCVGMATAQISDMVGEIFGHRQENRPPNSKTDSLNLAVLRQEVQQLKLNELMYQDLLRTYLSDSMQQVIKKSKIDSLRRVTQGVPLIIENDTLFVFYASRGGVSAADRAANTMQEIIALGKNRNVKPDSVYLLPLEDGVQTEIMYRRKVIVSVTENDALWTNKNINDLAEEERASIVAAIKTLQYRNSLLQTFKRIGIFLLVLAVHIVIFCLIIRLYKKMKLKIKANRQKWFKPIVFRNYEILNANRQANVAVILASAVRYLLIFIQLLIFIPLLFSVFPQTKPLASTLFGYIATPIKDIFYAIIHYIPHLFTVVIIWLCIRYLIKGISFITQEIQSEKLRIPGFYPEWAMPTFHVVKFLLYAFMIAMIFPHLPGSNTGTFKGISIFVGLIVSLGSGSAITNILAGLIMTYMRAFKIGDFIKLNDSMGNVIEKTAFVTRIRTTKNEIITIPNSFVLSSHTTNYSASARDYGLIIHTNVAIGYEVPWKTAHESLIKAAKRTPGVEQKREPFVLDIGLEDYYNLYEINVYILNADIIPKILTDLNSHIQDVLLEEGIELESPMLMSQTKAVWRKKGERTNGQSD
ncbi:MAG: mechanosensitive ion channel family protein [Bacteroidales bacterium]|jgi:small-conductance mechanosensitive channel|nr:mechanosensitive ion channel family protein [Bacteroidales bacterium]